MKCSKRGGGGGGGGGAHVGDDRVIMLGLAPRLGMLKDGAAGKVSLLAHSWQRTWRQLSGAMGARRG